MLFLSGFELYSRWVPLTKEGFFFSLESENFRFHQEPILTAPGFLLCAKDSLMWAVKCKKLDFRKS